MTRILPFLDEWNGGHLLWCEAYPGLALRGESREAALAKLPGELILLSHENKIVSWEPPRFARRCVS